MGSNKYYLSHNPQQNHNKSFIYAREKRKKCPKICIYAKKSVPLQRNWEIWPNVPINEPYGEADRMNEVNKEW